jgi:RNA polymerase sigma factor (sigma-70 family)
MPATTQRKVLPTHERDARTARAESDLGALLHRALASDSTAWRELESRYGPLLIHTALGVGLSHTDATDVAQLTWLRLWLRGHTIRNPSCLRAWLVSTARREGLRIALGQKRWVLQADPASATTEARHAAVHDSYPVDYEYEPEVARAMDQLPARYQVLMRLLTSDACPSYAEVAEAMHLPIGSIGPMRMRALEMLRRSLDAARPSAA